MNKQLPNKIYILIFQVTNLRKIHTKKKKDKKRQEARKLEPG